MQLAKVSLVSLAFTLFLGCQKVHPVPENLQFMVGEYEWSYSDDWDLHKADDSNTSYGIKIDKEGYLYTFEDGKEITKYKIEIYSEGNAFTTYSKHKTSLNGKVKTFEGGQRELIITGFPNSESGTSNHFFTHE